MTREVIFEEMVSALIKPGEDIAANITPEEANLWHLATGVAGEAGELLDAIKKQVIYKKNMDRENIIEELGDLFFYMEGICQALGVSRDTILEANIKKLSTRYSSLTYSNEAAVTRVDKNGN